MQFLTRLSYGTPDTELNAIQAEKGETVQNELDESDQSIDDAQVEQAELPKGTCIVCLKNLCDIILVPCFEIVICSICWAQQKQQHEERCDVLYKKNKRKLVTEKKKLKCPSCDNIVKECKEFHMASF